MSFKRYLLLAFIAISTTAYCSDFKFGIFLGDNINFATLNSKYSLEVESKMLPGMGFNTGLISKYKIGEKVYLFNNLELSDLSYSDNSNLVFTNEQGELIKTSKKRTFLNLQVQFNSILTYKVSNNLFVGGGISINDLLYSIIVFDEKIRDGKIFQNRYYKSITLGIPIMVNYEINRFFFNIRFNKGITNKIKGKESLINERDNVLIMGVGLYFN